MSSVCILCFSEEKAKLLRDVGGRIEDHDMTLTLVLRYVMTLHNSMAFNNSNRHVYVSGFFYKR